MVLCSHCWSSEVDIHVHRTTDEPWEPRQCSSCFRALAEVMDHAYIGREGEGGAWRYIDWGGDKADLIASTTVALVESWGHSNTLTQSVQTLAVLSDLSKLYIKWLWYPENSKKCSD